MTDSPTIADTIRALNTAEEDDNYFIIAAAINLYRESLRRLNGRILFDHKDARALLLMIELLLKDRPQTFDAGKGHRTEPSTEESNQILHAVDLDEPQPKPTVARRH